jgi:hypothetical protein
VTRTAGALFLAGFIVQAGALGLSGTSDVRQFKTWALTVLDRNFFDAYSYDIFVPPTGVSPIPDYPPLSVAMLAASGHVARWIRPDVSRDSRLLTVCVKAPLLVLQVVMCWLILKRGRQNLREPLGTPRNPLEPPGTPALWFWLNPAFILSGPVLGYLDLPCWMTGLGALLAATAGSAGLTGLLLAVSILVKPQGLFFILPIAAALWTKPAALARVAALTTGIVVLGILPFALATPHGFWISMTSNFSEDMLSGDALNLWWLVSAVGFVWTFRGSAITRVFGSPAVSMFVDRVGADPRAPATLGIASAALRLVSSARAGVDLTRAAALGALVVHIYFVFGIAVHENHLVYALPLIGLAAISDVRYRRLYVAASAFVVFNLLVMVGLGDDFPRLPRTGAFLPLTVAGALAGLALFAWHLRIFGATVGATSATARPTAGRAP